MKRLGAAAAAGATIGAAGPAWAHAFAERYDLPLPFELYVGGAGAAVAASFVVIGLFVRDAAWLRPYRRLDLLARPVGRFVAHPATVSAVRLAAVLLFLLVVAAGAMGDQNPLRNIAPVTVWIAWWVGMAMVSAFLGDLWAVVNPWATLFAWAESAWRRLVGGRAFGLGLVYPVWLGVWPAVALLLLFTWTELVSARAPLPSYVATMALVYSALTWAGMFAFGRERWLAGGEVFSLVFGMLARFAPVALAPAGGGGGPATLVLRPHAVGLLPERPASLSMAALVLLYLVGVMFDGILATPAWGQLEGAVVPLLPLKADAAAIAARTTGLIAVWLVAACVYLLVSAGMAGLAGRGAAAGEVALWFVFALLPIAIAYHFAHYLTYLLIQGQYLIPLVSDPFGWNWNLFGTAWYRVDVGVVGARFAWYAAVVSIVVGHVVAVLLGHIIALAAFGGRRAALVSQGPLTALMVAFTVTSLTIMAEPIVSKPPAAAGGGIEGIAVPDDALMPEPGTGRLLRVGPGRTAATRLVYSAMSSPFHDGTAMTAADLLYPFAMAFRWGAGGAQSGRDAAVAATTDVLRGTLKGLRFLGSDATSRTIRFGDLTYAREQLMVEVYVDAAVGPSSTAEALAPPWSPVPWHAIALMEEAVARGWAAFSEAEAKRLGVEWLDPVRSEALKPRLKALVAEFESEAFVPAPLEGLVSSAEARARWKALAEFHAKSGHFLVTNGPYTAKSWVDGATVLDVVRDPRYPLGVGSYDSYAIPRRAFVTTAESDADGLALAVEIETVDKVMRDYKIVRRPLREAVAAFGRRTIPRCDFVALGADGRVALAGEGRYREDGAMVLGLKGRLGPGSYMVSVALYPNGNAVGAEVRRFPYRAP